LTPAEFRAKRDTTVNLKKEKAFKEWRAKYQTDDKEDDIIFGEDEEIHENIKLDSIED